MVRLIASNAVKEWDAYEELGVLVLGIRLDGSLSPFESIIFQIDVEGSEQRRDAWGMCVVTDGETSYSVRRFDCDLSQASVYVEFDEGLRHREALNILLPGGDDAQLGLVARMAAVHRAYPVRRKPCQ